jgi:hypothetical protein
MFDTKSKLCQTFQGSSNDGATLSHTDCDSLNTHPAREFKQAKYIAKGKGKSHPCTGTEALYRPYGP